MKLILSDPDPDVLAAWRTQFVKWPEVEIRDAHVLETPADAFVLPGNSFGFLDSGLGLEISERLGWELQEELRRRIRSEHAGELLVGQAVVVRLPALPRAVVYAPTWRTPRKLDGTLNVFLASRGAFLELSRQGGDRAIQSLALLGLGVKEGGLDPRISARQIRYAYEIHKGLRGLGDKNLTQQIRREKKLISIPGIGKEEGAESE